MILKTVLMNRKGLGEHNILEQVSSLKHFHKLELRFERFGRGLERSGQYLRTYLSRNCSNHNESTRQLIRSTDCLGSSTVNRFHIQLLNISLADNKNKKYHIAIIKWWPNHWCPQHKRFLIITNDNIQRTLAKSWKKDIIK